VQNTLFETKFYGYYINDWESKKEKISEKINVTSLIRKPDQLFTSDRGNNNYQSEFVEIFKNELSLFSNEIKVDSLDIGDVWTVSYAKGDFHIPHNHSGVGYSGIIYLDYNETLHSPTYFINPSNNPITDQTEIKKIEASEGLMIIIPSNILHYTLPNNSHTIKTIIGFDLKFK
jgi:hypothetical protein